MTSSQASAFETSPRSCRTTWAQRRALGAIRWYQRVREGRPSPCRFFPTCSSYALEAVEVHGTRRGIWLGTKRLLRCRPLGPSGIDLVPHHDTHLDAAGSPPRSSVALNQHKDC